MNSFIVFVTELGAASLDTVWLPMLVWTALAGAVLLGLRVRPHLHPVVQCDARSALLLALPLSMMLAVLIDAPFSLIQTAEAPVVEEMVSDSGPIPVLDSAEVGDAAALEPIQTPTGPAFWLGLFTIAAGLAAIMRSGMLARDAVALYRFRRSLRWVSADEVGRRDERSTQYAVTDGDIAPMTFGLICPVVVVPASLMNRPEELRMALAHEHVHVRRRDYLRQWVEQAVAGIFVIHPLTGLLRRQIDDYRERACDAEVLAGETSNPHDYALLLYRAASSTLNAPRSGMPMARRRSDLRGRIAALELYLQDGATLRRLNRTSIAAAVLLLIVTMGAVGAFDVVGQTNEAPEVQALEASPSLLEQAPVEDSLSTNAIQIRGGQITYSGVRQRLTGGTWIDDPSGYVSIYIVGMGRLVFSGEMFEGAERVAEVSGSTLRAETDLIDLRIEADHPILPQPAGTLWMRYEPHYVPEVDPDAHFQEAYELGQLEPDAGSLFARSGDGRWMLRFAPITVNGRSEWAGEKLGTGTIYSTNRLAYLWWYLPDLGRIVLRRAAFPGAEGRALVEGGTIQFTGHPGLETITSSEPVYGGRERASFWYRLDEGFRPESGSDQIMSGVTDYLPE